MNLLSVPCLFAMLVGSLILTSCSESGVNHNEEEVPLHVHIESWFQNDGVMIRIDNELVFNEEVTTNPSLGLAKTIDLNVSSGEHRIEARMNDRIIVSETFNPVETPWLCVYYDPDTELGGLQKKEVAPGYD